MIFLFHVLKTICRFALPTLYFWPHGGDNSRKSQVVTASASLEEEEEEEEARAKVEAF